jgi:hypothetical protein
LGHCEYMNLCDAFFVASLYQSEVLLERGLFGGWRNVRDWLDLETFARGIFCIVFALQRLSRMRSKVRIGGHVVYKIVQEYQVLIHIKRDIFSFSIR